MEDFDAGPPLVAALPSTRAPLLAELGMQQLAGLAAMGDGLRAELPRLEQIFTRLLGAAAGWRSGGAPVYASDVVDDHTPYELSITLGGEAPELRLLVETNDGDPSLAGRWRAARAAGRWLRDDHGACLERLDRIADLFEPRTASGLLALWHAVAVRAGRPPAAKAYLDLRARGAAHAPALLEEALGRLGLARAYPRVMGEAGARGAALDELVYFSLDLTAHDQARVKVYVRHHHASAHDAERVLGRLGGVEPGEAGAFCAAMLGGDGPYTTRPLVSCWSFSAGPEPTGATIYAPIAYYVRDDEEARARIHRWLAGKGLDADRYDGAVSAFARRPLAAGVGMHSYVAFKRERGAPRVTFYLAPEAYTRFAPGALAARPLPPPTRARTAAELVARYEDVTRIADHPLFGRLAREPAAVAPLWTILANNWVAIGDQFPRWLAHLVARVEDDGVRSILAKQLDDELGHGVPAAAHRLLYLRMLADLEPYAPAGDRAALLAPGQRFAPHIGHSYLQRPALEAIGGTLIAEVFGKQVDQRIGELLRRQQDLDPASLTWLVLHETLEVDHADEALVLSALVPDDASAQAAVCRGATALADLAWRYFDELYAVIFS